MSKFNPAVKELHFLLLPYVTTIVAERIQHFLDTTVLSPDELRAIMRIRGQEVRADGGTFAEIKAAMKDIRDRSRNLKDVPEEHKAAVIEEMSHRTTAGVVTAWLMALVAAAPGGPDDERTLDLSTLDDAMLPPFHEGMDMLFIFILAHTDFDIDDARVVLRQVRAALPSEKIIPDPVKTLLLADNVTVDGVTDSD